jgi:hypothetical protein
MSPPSPRRHEGRSRDRHASVVRVAMDAASVRRVLLAGRNARGVRRSRVVLAPRPWRLSPPACAGGATVTIKAAHRGELEVSRKPIARGKPGCPGCTCGSTRVLSSTGLSHTGLRAQSAPGFPCALSSRGSNELAKPEQNRAAGTRPHVYPRHCEER